MSHLDDMGYVGVMCPTHPRARGGVVREHILVAEQALGHYLPKGAQVHHHNENKADNRPRNLVILQNRREHIQLHYRRRIQLAGGNPWTQYLCHDCGLVKDPSEFGTRRTPCKACISKINRKRYPARVFRGGTHTLINHRI